MSLEQIVNLIFVIVGVIIAIVGLYWKSRERKDVAWRDRVSGGLEYETALRKMEEHMMEIDKTLEEFHSTANSAILELDDKYQELLFLYSLIDEKKKEVADIYSVPAPVPVQPVKAAKPAKAEAKPRTTEARASKSSHPRRKEILNLSKQGLSVAEIAEELNIGQDMVKLILEMGKPR